VEFVNKASSEAPVCNWRWWPDELKLRRLDLEAAIQSRVRREKPALHCLAHLPRIFIAAHHLRLHPARGALTAGEFFRLIRGGEGEADEWNDRDWIGGRDCFVGTE
jgi:hypothetical protein